MAGPCCSAVAVAVVIMMSWSGWTPVDVGAGRGWRSGPGSCCWPRTGLPNAEIAERVGVSRPTVNLWRARYAEQRAGRAGR